MSMTIGPKLGMPTLPQPQVGIKAICVVTLEGYAGQLWPNVFAVTPRKGETVMSMDGNSLTILDVVHSEDQGGSPFLSLMLGRSPSESSPISGGGGSGLEF